MSSLTLFEIDKIRSRAHRAGWQDAGINPFGRVRTRDTQLGDLEQQHDPRHVNFEDPATQPDEEDAPRSPKRVDTEKDGENVSGSTVVDDSIGSSALSRRATGVKENGSPVAPNEGILRSDTEREEERKRKQKEMLQKKIPIGQQIKTVLFPHWYTINWLLVCVPVGIGINFVKGINPLAVFIVNFVAIIPLASTLSFATEELAMRVGETLGGLLNATFGNAVELIVAIIALAHKEIIIVQTSLIGSMLSNLLIVLGMCFFFGGINRMEQFFNVTVAQTASSLLALSVGSLLIPTGFTWNGVINPATSDIDEEISRGTAIILLVVYGAYLFFQLKSHKDMYSVPSEKAPKRRVSKKEEGDTFRALAGIGGRAAASSGGQANRRSVVQVPDDEPEEPSLSLIGAFVTLCSATALIGANAEFLVGSINEVTCLYNVSQYFVGLILLPIVGNATEHATAVTVAIKDKMDLAIGVAVGSSMQIALLVLPLTVVIGWIIHSDMTLVFDDFQIAVLFVAVILVNYLIGDGKSHWLEGVLLMALYLIIAVAAWFYPVKAPGECS